MEEDFIANNVKVVVDWAENALRLYDQDGKQKAFFRLAESRVQKEDNQ